LKTKKEIIVKIYKLKGKQRILNEQGEYRLVKILAHEIDALLWVLENEA
jgi:hypothetical protein